MIDGLIFGILLLFGAFYALLLGYMERWLRIVSRATWLVVIFGTGTTLALIGLFPIFSVLTYWKIWAAFACTGAPVIARSIIRQLLHDHMMRGTFIENATPRE